jgi:NosR/NirI family transcriptional regulator, nitrous oxide reductase regulator
MSLLAFNVLAIQRFPKPEFESDYTIPAVQVTRVQPVIMEYLDMVIFIVCMSVITWLILEKRSRKAVFWTSVFALLYFGFYRKGCICPVGSLQNVTMAVFDPEYKIPLTAIGYFVIPLGFTLFFGRTFCAGVCPLGVIQDLFALRPVSLKPWIRYLFGLIPFIYLGLAVLYAATGTDFIICRYDPFVGFFRHNGTYLMFIIGGVLLLTGIFIARPYCRFFCPYGVLLNLVSRVSRRHLSIAPGSCINCKLCENTCPFDAIDKPTGLVIKNDNRELVKKLIIYGLITPVLMAVCGWTLSKYHEDLANVNFKVRLAQEMMTLDTKADALTLPVEVTTFQASGVAVENLYKEAAVIVRKFYAGSWIIGCFIGLVFGLTLSRLTIFSYQNEFLANKGNCLSCARCLDYCPVKRVTSDE